MEHGAPPRSSYKVFAEITSTINTLLYGQSQGVLPVWPKRIAREVP